jgi:predicted Holliday junction resolvase-like endonuclease
MAIEYFIFHWLLILLLILVCCLLLLSFTSLKDKIRALKEENQVQRDLLQRIAMNQKVVGAEKVLKQNPYAESKRN